MHISPFSSVSASAQAWVQVVFLSQAKRAKQAYPIDAREVVDDELRVAHNPITKHTINPSSGLARLSP